MYSENGMDTAGVDAHGKKKKKKKKVWSEREPLAWALSSFSKAGLTGAAFRGKMQSCPQDSFKTSRENKTTINYAMIHWEKLQCQQRSSHTWSSSPGESQAEEQWREAVKCKEKIKHKIKYEYKFVCLSNADMTAGIF